MLFGQSFLPTIPARWTLQNGSMTSSEIVLASGGTASVQLTKEDISVIPEALRLTIVSDTYVDGYISSAYVEILITTTAGQYIHVVCPIVNVGNNIHTVEFPLSAMEYSTFQVRIVSAMTITISSWLLSAPLEGDTTEIINEIRGELPKLLYDYNTARFDIGQVETTIGLISANLLENTDLNGHVQLTYNASQSATLVIRIKDNEVSELYTPILYDIKAGRGSIGIPHGYLSKTAGIHTFTVTAQVTVGSLYFDVRSILYTIDGGHLAERVMDVGMDVRDLTLRRTASEAEPSWIYAIGIDDGQAMVRARPYSDVAATVWEPIAIVGEAVECAIEFEGEWRIDGEVFRFDTEEAPWVFWVDLEETLWAQPINGTKVQLATGAVKVSAIKGYRNTSFLAQDQGLLVVYIKSDGLVYYRNYCMYTETSKIWEAERVIEEFTGTAVAINTFRTNDYRVGINITDASEITYSLLTSRNWAGIAIHPEYITAKLGTLDVTLTEVFYTSAYAEEYVAPVLGALQLDFLYAASDNAIVEIGNIANIDDDYGYRIRFITNRELYNLTTTDFTLRDSLGTTFVCQAVESISSTEHVLDFMDFNNAVDELTLQCLGLTVKNAAGYSVDPFGATFTPVGLVPSAVPVPEVEVIWNE